MKKEIRIKARGAMTVPYELLEPFQGDLKNLDKVEYEKLRKRIIDDGFSFVIHVWQNDGKNFIIDGHQRLRTIKNMVEVEGWAVPELPVAIIDAENFEEAKRQVLAGASQYGKMQGDGLYQFAVENDIPFDEIVANFHFPEINLQKFGEEYFDLDLKPETIDPISGEVHQIPSSSDQVRMVQLFFNAETHGEFLQKIEKLSKKYDTKNVTDTVMEAVRAAHQTNE